MGSLVAKRQCSSGLSGNIRRRAHGSASGHGEGSHFGSRGNLAGYFSSEATGKRISHGFIGNGRGVQEPQSRNHRGP